MTTSRTSRSRERALGAAEVRAIGDASHIARPLPDGCPVKPLGMAIARTPTAVFLAASGGIVELTGQAMGAGNLEALFSPENRWLWEHWPRISKEGVVNGIRAELARADLLAAAGRRGIWHESEKVRGAGAWKGEDGQLVLHLGDRVMMGGKLHPWGELDGYVYPAAAALRGPALGAQPDGAAGPAHQVLRMLESWHWKHGIAPRLALGWICAAMVGGALKWRPAVWPTGDRGTGKSTLIDLIKGLLGTNGSITTANTTEAGIRQALMNKSLPVMLDELEAQENGGDRVHGVIELLRQSASGTVGLRGGADHKGVQFELRSPMLASSIMVPPLRSQDRSRIALLELLPLRENARAPALTGERIAELGERLLRRMLDAWPELPERLETWRAQLKAHAGLDDRGADQYGTLLACADVALDDAAPDPDALAEQVGRKGEDAGVMALLGDMRADDVPDWRRCLDHMLTHTAEGERGNRVTLGLLVARAAGKRGGEAIDDAQAVLNGYGLRVAVEGGGAWLAVANQHKGLAQVFERQIWAGRSGTSGGWRQALLRVPDAWSRPAALRFDGIQSRVVMVPIGTALNEPTADEGAMA